MNTALLTVGFEMPGHGADLRFRSDQSLLDGDIIIVEPDVSEYFYRTHEDGPFYIEALSEAQLRRDAAHWREELDTALRAGKTVFVFFTAVQEMPPVTGATSARGNPFADLLAGSPAAQPWTNYACLPVGLGRVVPRGGREIRVAGDPRWLAAYWREFGGDSEYEAYLDQPVGTPVFVTKTGGKVVGTVIEHGAGHLVLLPPLRYDMEDLFEQVSEEGDYDWTAAGRAYGARLTVALLEVDRALRGGAGTAPPPDWAGGAAYRTAREEALGADLAAVEASIARLRERATEITRALDEETALRQLLFGTGAPLEAAVLAALRAMGFSAERLAAHGSEFDAVFAAPEGRFLGEAEGRDAKPVGVEKLDQLERNLREDFARGAHEAYAKGVLFANAHRLTPPGQRGPFFTEKCLAAARRSGVALVRTPDLFPVAAYLRAHPDPEYAAGCRRALLETAGDVVRWPTPLPATPDASPPSAGDAPALPERSTESG